MSKKKFSRRQFLKTFAMASSASLFGLNSACGSSELHGARVVYGPPPLNIVHPEVTMIYFLDGQSNKILLRNNPGVPVQVVCRFDFSKSMNTTAPVTITLKNGADASVLISKSWANDLTLVVTPVSGLQFNTDYILSLGTDAEDIYGNKVTLTAGATASFKTVSA